MSMPDGATSNGPPPAKPSPVVPLCGALGARQPSAEPAGCGNTDKARTQTERFAKL